MLRFSRETGCSGDCAPSWHDGPVNDPTSSRGGDDSMRGSDQRGAVVWLTGLSGAGKSTLAAAVQQRLVEAGHLGVVLDGDVVRRGLCSDLGFSPVDRAENVRRVAHVARLFADSGLVVLVALISPYRDDRERARAICQPKFYEVYANASLQICERRDPKGLYRKARTGELAEFTGVSAPYEEPLAPDTSIDCETLTEEESATRLLEFLRTNGVLGGR